MTDAEIVNYINTFNCEWIVLTGGEPSLQIDDEFIHTLHVGTGMKIAIETNGTRRVPDEIDWVTLSPKGGMTDVSTASIASALRVQRADEVKVVDTGQNLEHYFHLPQVRSNTRMYLQPCWVPDPVQAKANERRTVERVLADSRWTLSVQLHRMLGID